MTLLNCLLSAWYGLPFVSKDNLLVTTINGTGAAIEIIYVIIFLVFAPKKQKRLVIKTKSVEFMPLFLSLFIFLCGTSWFIYGLLGRDPFIAETSKGTIHCFQVSTY
ncbi:Bidirectional sugar transporter SWEET1 [Linum perenne]